jgi:phosphatidylserine/phosphatidylglycerophosphate/cardiolipin synthase-like enzyme
VIDLPVVALSLLLGQVNVFFSSDSLFRRLRDRIDAAESSIDMCFYNCDSSYIIDALIAAKRERNVRVRVVTDDARLNKPWVRYLGLVGIPVWSDSLVSRSQLMHNKFAVFDFHDADPENDWLWTGSFNVSAGDFNADNAIEIRDSGLCHAYTREFEQMWGGSDSLPDRNNSYFHGRKGDSLSRHTYVVGADTFRVFFSPQNRPVDSLARLVRDARTEVGFAIYAYTHRPLALAMQDRNEHAVWVGGVFDRSESTASASYFDTLRRWGIPVHTDRFLAPANMLHEKIMVIDRRISAAGSVNWSNAGNSQNDENSLLISSPRIAELYRTEIERRFNEAGGEYGHNELGLTAILAPGAQADSDETVIPGVRLANSGLNPANFRLRAWITDSAGSAVWSDSLAGFGLLPGAGEERAFRAWSGPHPPGRYHVTFVVQAYGDRNPGDDTLMREFRVVAPPFWTWCADVPAGPRGKRVGAGCGLAYLPGDALYCLKGNNTCEFLCYDLAGDYWTQIPESIPAIGRSGETHRVGRGGALCADEQGQRLYVVKGRRSREFWRCSPILSDAGTGNRRAGHVWEQLADVPEPSGGLRFGVGMCAVADDTSASVYLLTGSGGFGFMRYDPASGTWEMRAAAPAGPDSIGFGPGSCLAGDGEGKLYALKGRRDEFYSYDAAFDRWDARARLPRPGRYPRRSGEGAALAVAALSDSDAGRVWALKGGRTDEFWCYAPSEDSWTLAASLPVRGRRRTGPGSALTGTGSALFAVRGGNTLEFLQFGRSPKPGLSSHRVERRAAAEQETGRGSSLQLSVEPNPLNDNGLVWFDPGRTGPFRLALYDVAGRLVRTLASGAGRSGPTALRLRRGSLPSGVYLLRLETTDVRSSRKLLVSGR